MVSSTGSLSFSGVIAEIPLGDIKVSFGPDNKGMELSL